MFAYIHNSSTGTVNIMVRPQDMYNEYATKKPHIKKERISIRGRIRKKNYNKNEFNNP
jgi:hypothetical protein